MSVAADEEQGKSLADGKAHAEYLRSTACCNPPESLGALLHAILLDVIEEEPSKRSQPGSIVLTPPTQRRHLHPFLIPLATNTITGAVTGFLRWPTPPPNMPLPIVRTVPSPTCTSHFQLELLAPSADAFLNLTLATADATSHTPTLHSLPPLLPATAHYHTQGSFSPLNLTLPQFLILKVARFPSAYESLARAHLAPPRSDVESALVTYETAAAAFPGWARPHVVHTMALKELGRGLEARDAARFALQLPLWTVGAAAGVEGRVEEVATLAGYADPGSLGKIYLRLAEDGRKDEVEGGKPPEQVALDRAAYLLDYAVAEGKVDSWEEVQEDLAKLYEDGRMPEVANFVRS